MQNLFNFFSKIQYLFFLSATVQEDKKSISVIVDTMSDPTATPLAVDSSSTKSPLSDIQATIAHFDPTTKDPLIAYENWKIQYDLSTSLAKNDAVISPCDKLIADCYIPYIAKVQKL